MAVLPTLLAGVVLLIWGLIGGNAGFMIGGGLSPLLALFVLPLDFGSGGPLIRFHRPARRVDNQPLPRTGDEVD